MQNTTNNGDVKLKAKMIILHITPIQILNDNEKTVPRPIISQELIYVDKKTFACETLQENLADIF